MLPHSGRQKVPGPVQPAIRTRMVAICARVSLLCGRNLPSRRFCRLSASLDFQFRRRYGRFSLFRCDILVGLQRHGLWSRLGVLNHSSGLPHLVRVEPEGILLLDGRGGLSGFWLRSIS